MPVQKQQRTGNQALVREINLATIMKTIHQRAPVSRAALAETTGLNKTTVSSLVQELIDNCLVQEVGLTSAGTGRPAVMLTLNPMAGCIVSVEIGVDFTLVIAANFAAEVIWRRKEVHQPQQGQQAITEQVITLLRQAVDAGRQTCDTLLGLAVGVPGLIDQQTGTLLFAPNLGWQNVPLRQILEQSFDCPIFINNEGNMAAWGEYLLGAAGGFNDVLYVSAGVGLGGGIIHNGQLLNGTSGYAGEFGHMTMNPNGEPCNCGNTGCWETQVSQSALFGYIRAAIKNHGLDSVFSSNLENLTVQQVVEAAQSGDAVALQSLAQVGRYLGIGIASLVNTLNPRRVVFGGILSRAGDFLLPAINAELQQRALRWTETSTEVVLAKHGFDACVMGGVATVLQSILSNPGGAIT